MRIAILSAIGAVAMSIAASGQLHAADMPMKAPPAPVAPTYSWTGFYLGGNFGGAWGDPTASFAANDPLASTLGPGGPIKFDPTGPLGGFQAGINWQFNQSWVFGFETDFDFSAISGKGSSAPTPPGGFAGSLFQQTAAEKVQWFGTVRGRVGYLVTSNLMVYGTGGFAYGKVAQSGSYALIQGTGAFIGGIAECAPGGPCYVGSSQPVLTGWTAGGGLEYALSHNWTVKAEYLYVSLGGNTFNEPNLGGALVPAPTGSITAHFSDTNFQVARGGVNYKF
jgi:outer membrane immunogenic protein